MKQAIAPALFTQSAVRLEPLATGRALADELLSTSMANQTRIANTLIPEGLPISMVVGLTKTTIVPTPRNGPMAQ
jgi:hypothetical protein